MAETAKILNPDKTILIADKSSNSDYCCADLLAQAEHDILAKPILITTSEKIGLERII